MDKIKLADFLSDPRAYLDRVAAGGDTLYINTSPAKVVLVDEHEFDMMRQALHRVLTQDIIE